MAHNSVPGVDPGTASEVVDQLASRLVGSLDLQLVLKHIHWNVTGMSFIAVHEMLDEQVDAVRAMTDDLAERIAILGGTPIGTPGHLVTQRDWDDYPLGRADVVAHLTELDRVYEGVIEDNRAAIDTVGGLDPITEDILIGQTGRLELFQWFVRSHIEHSVGAVQADPDAGTNPDGRETPEWEETEAGVDVPHPPERSAGNREMTSVGVSTAGQESR